MKVALSTLGEEATIIMGQSPPGESYNREGKGVPLLNGPSEFGTVHPIEVQWTTSPTKFCQQGDVLFCVRGATAGRLNTADKKYCIGRGLAAIRVKPGKFDSGFLRYVLANGYSRFQSRGVGSTFINISADELASFPVPSLPLDEQRRIAEILDKADALRAKRRAALAQLHTLTQSIFFDMFGDPATNPRGWLPATLGAAILSCSDGPHVSPSYVEEGVPFLSTRHVRAGAITWNDLKFISKADAELHWKKCRPQRNDILYTKGGTTGLAAAVDTDCAFAIWVHIALLRPNPEKVDTRWLESMLNSEFCYRQSQKLTHGIANRDLGLTRMVRIRIYLPPLSMQKQFSVRAATVEAHKSTQSLASRQLDSLFLALQHRAFGAQL